MTSDVGYALFETPIGRCGLAWGRDGVLAAQLPEADEETAHRRLSARLPGAVNTPPSGEAAEAIARIAALLAGARDDLASIRLDMAGVPDFHRDVYGLTRTILPGTTLTYGAVAARLGDRNLARAVGQALGRNPFPIIVPCHRVMGADGRFVGFTAEGGVATKQRMLEIEGALAPQPPGLFESLPHVARPRRHRPRRSDGAA